MSPASGTGVVGDTSATGQPVRQLPWGLDPWTVLCLLAVALGVVLRGLWFALPRSLWIDESMLALSLLTRPLAGLFGSPLAFEQSGPPGFLVVEWAIAHGTAPTEFALRAPSLVVGIAVLGLMWWVARSLLPAGALALVVALAAVSPYLVRYAAELKPYEFDAAATLAVLGCAFGVLRRPEAARAWAALAVTGLTALLFSTPSAFVLAAAALACLSSTRVRAAPAWRRHLFATTLAWGCLFGVIYLACYRPTSGNPYLLRFWQEAFLGRGVARAYGLHRDWTIPALAGGLIEYLPPGSGVMLQLFPLAGIAWLGRRHGLSCVPLLVGPIALAYLASAAKLYPVATRLMLFAMPLVVIIFVAGLTAAWEVANRTVVRLAAGLAAAWSLLLGAVWSLPILLGVWVPPSVSSDLDLYMQDLSPLLEDARYRSATSEPVYLFARALPAWIFYSTDWSAGETSRAVSLMQLASTLGPNSGNRPSRDRPVVDEGVDLVFKEGRRLYVVGVPTGSEDIYRPRSGGSPREHPVDAGWGENEIRRMRHETGSCFWVLLSRFHRVELRALQLAAASEGFRVDRTHEEIGARLDRYCKAR